MADWTEIRIPVPWGFIAAKTRGLNSGEPMICVHGDVDNAASFDNLLPLLPQKYYFVCVDLPGHGMSSHYGPGITYKFIDYIMALKRVVDYFKWPKVNIMGHHTGGLIGMYFAACFSDDVKRLIILDALVIETSVRFNQYLSNLADNLIKNDQVSEKLDVRATIKLWRTFPLSPQAEKLLLERNLVKLKGGFELAIDPRVAFIFHLPDLRQRLVPLLRSLKCELLLIMSKEVMSHKSAFPVKMLINTFRKNCERVEYHLLDDACDIHINRPEKVNGIIYKFLEIPKSSL